MSVHDLYAFTRTLTPIKPFYSILLIYQAMGQNVGYSL